MSLSPSHAWFMNCVHTSGSMQINDFSEIGGQFYAASIFLDGNVSTPIPKNCFDNVSGTFERVFLFLP